MAIIKEVKEIADLIKNLGNTELYRKIVELEGDIIELTRQNRLLSDQVSDLNSKLRIKEKLTFKSPFWFMDDDETPFCPSCWENSSKAIHMIEIYDDCWDCPTCKLRITPNEDPLMPSLG
ncbi:MAG: hypothetical protein H8E14_15720 [Candidatus Marinimicrobia bacterium]|nr:hypothetical protein [Candidatus Neomarinimicrobiota bacterium]